MRLQVKKKRYWRVMLEEGVRGMAYCPKCDTGKQRYVNIDPVVEMARCDGCGDVSETPMRPGEVVQIVRGR